MILNKKYKEEIDKIVMNDEMKKRILKNVLVANENDNNAEKSLKIKTTKPKINKYYNFKKNMQMVAACGAIVLCLSVVKNYPMLLKPAPNDLEQKETVKSNDDENNNLKTNNDNNYVNNKDSKEISNNNNKEDQTVGKNNSNYNNGDSYVKRESSDSSKIRQEEKDKDNLQSNSSIEAEKSQTSQNNDNKSIEDSNILSKTNPEGDINKKENKNPTSTESKTKDQDIMQNRIPENNEDNSVLGTSVAAEKVENYRQEYKTLDEAEKALNLKVSPLKTLSKGFKMGNISVISNEIIQVDYNDGNNNIIFRAGKGIDNISGDYNVYQVNDTLKVNGLNVNLEGNKSEEYNLATWEKDGISYSISAENSIDEKTILGMII
ncbi:hypothetical protein [Clostridium chromiireducens]|uniref:hypothetical protein n=1 Tax=Clostridium chromiireducens TaxID=225345 RepID=UPI0009A538FA|nr:hypothetical protein [Clostridium chromiireducens]